MSEIVHKSATCVVAHALDHADTDVDGKPRKVALKFMLNKDQWEKELHSRGGTIEDNTSTVDSNFVVPVLRKHDWSAQGGEQRAQRDLARLEATWSHREGAVSYQFVLAMPRLERSLTDILFHEHLAPSPETVHWSAVRIIVKQLVLALQYFHGLKMVHGDVKPLNIMRTFDDKYVLIDLDAAHTFGEPTGLKTSAAFCAPEMVYEYQADSLDDNVLTRESKVCIRSPAVPGSDPVLASPALDLWSLGVVLFQLCTGGALFPARTDDTLDDVSLRALGAWSEGQLKERVAMIHNRLARNLVLRLLQPDPDNRISLDDVAKHPFVTGAAQQGRMLCEPAFYDLFRKFSVHNLSQTPLALMRIAPCHSWLPCGHGL